MSGSVEQLTVDVPEELKESLFAELSEHGVAGIWENGEPLPGITRLEIYFNAPLNINDLKLCIQSVFQQAGVPPPQITSGIVEERDWLGEWKKSYVSFPIGRTFFIIPSWSESPCPPGRLPIRIDPGQAFGTGTHETTQLTLELLEERASQLEARTILDLGTGSGILAIAARLLGGRWIVGCDIDLDSIGVAVENIERNVGDCIPAFCGSIDAVPSDFVDLLLCNLTADVIIQLFDEVVRALRPGGSAILSGILVEQRNRIHEVVSGAGWIIEDDRTRGEWIAMVIRKPV